MPDIIDFSKEQAQIMDYIIDLLDEDQICTDIGLNTVATDGMLDVVIGCDQKNPVCPDCRRASRKTVNNRDGRCRSRLEEVFIENGQKIRLTLIRYRRKCDCGNVFYTNIPQKLRPGAQAKKASYRAIADTSLVLTQNSVGVPFSKAEGSTVLNGVVKALWDIAMGKRAAQDRLEQEAAENFKKIMSFKPCSTLFFIPFEFGKSERCCVCGWNGATAYLLDILESSSIQEIEKCITKRVQQKDRVHTVYCFVNDDVVNIMQYHFQYANIRYSRKCLQDYIRTYYKELSDPMLSPKSSARKKILSIVKNALHTNYLSEFFNWWFDLKWDPEKMLQKKSERIHELFCDNKYETITGDSFRASYDSSSFASLLGWIKENGNSSFWIMKARMLLNQDIQTSGIVVNHINAHQAQYIYDFGVDIDDLMKDQERYHQFLEDICGIEFKKNRWQEELKAISEANGE